MKITVTDANFPKTADGRVYHLGLRAGEVANRVLTVGSASRAEAISHLLDQRDESDIHGDVYAPSPEVFRLLSERGFLTYTGRFRGVPVSIVSIGMGYPNMDFFVREVRECVQGDLVIVRLGSCGTLLGRPVGSLILPTGSVSVRRNYDYDFVSAPSSDSGRDAYQISKKVPADPELHNYVAKKLKTFPPLVPPAEIIDDTVNASADTFYSTQGRVTSFPDHNEKLIDHVIEKVPGVASMEMETFHMLHLASVWRAPEKKDKDKESTSTSPSTPAPRIRAASVQMVFADRVKQGFITPERVNALEEWSGRAVLEALTEFHIPEANLQDESVSIWAKERTTRSKRG